MSRDHLITQILTLCPHWTAQERGMLRGRWGAKASLEQLQVIHDRLFDLAADGTDIMLDEPEAPEQVLRNAARFRDRSKLEKIAAWLAYEQKQRFLAVAEGRAA